MFLYVTEKKFLAFFFNRLRMNESGRYFPSFPYISPCGRERNFVRCDDKPMVFTHVLGEEEDNLKLSYGHAGDLLTVPFQPSCIYVAPDSGRVYHPAPERVGGIGLVRSQLAIEFSQYFTFEPGLPEPTKFTWLGKTYQLRSDWLPRTWEVLGGRHVDSGKDSEVDGGLEKGFNEPGATQDNPAGLEVVSSSVAWKETNLLNSNRK